MDIKRNLRSFLVLVVLSVQMHSAFGVGVSVVWNYPPGYGLGLSNRYQVDVWGDVSQATLILGIGIPLLGPVIGAVAPPPPFITTLSERESSGVAVSNVIFGSWGAIIGRIVASRLSGRPAASSLGVCLGAISCIWGSRYLNKRLRQSRAIVAANREAETELTNIASIAHTLERYMGRDSTGITLQFVANDIAEGFARVQRNWAMIYLPQVVSAGTRREGQAAYYRWRNRYLPTFQDLSNAPQRALTLPNPN